MTAAESGLRGQRVRAVARAAWMFLALAVLYVVARVWAAGGFPPLISTAAGLAPLLFAAAVAYARPSDRRFGWAVWAIAGSVAVPLIARLLPELVFRYAPGDWSNAAFLLQDIVNVLLTAGNGLLLVGLALFGLALGGARSAFGALILLCGAIVGLANLVWLFANPIEDLPLLTIVESVTFSTLTALAWAFVFAAAVDAVRSLLIVGTGLLFANVVVNAALLWWAPQPGTNFDVLALIVGGLGLVGWLALAAGALRGELAGPEDAGSARRRARRQ